MYIKPEIAIIEWIDSSLQNGQVDKTEFPGPVVITSVGFLVKDVPFFVVLARDDMGDGDYRGLLAIPRSSIISINGAEAESNGSQTAPASSA